jgi:hypothetical protein
MILLQCFWRVRKDVKHFPFDEDVEPWLQQHPVGDWQQYVRSDNSMIILQGLLKALTKSMEVWRQADRGDPYVHQAYASATTGIKIHTERRFGLRSMKTRNSR